MWNPILIFCLIGTVLSSSLKIGTNLNNILNTAETVNIFVTIASQNGQLYKTLDTQSFSSRGQKIGFLATSLQTQAQSTQQNVVNFLSTQPTEYKTFWISNKIFIPNANKSLIDLLANFPEVVKIEEEIVIKLEAAIDVSPEIQQSGQTWGLQKIQATKAWNTTRGAGVVVANIDSGVLYTHEALRYNFRYSYGWYDPFNKTIWPNDQNGHGTHVMGTIAGTNGIGVAPESTWIACKGCSNVACPEHALLECGQWILCPSRPNGSYKNCSMAPHVVCNSWGGGQGNSSWYDDIINAWVAVEIIPVFAIGNSGPDCKTAGNPGDRPGVIGVGSTDLNDTISIFSSVGPTFDNRIKPDIVAPGSNIRSTSHLGNASYVLMNGTSMAAPHVAGTIALMLAKTKGLTFQEVRKILERTVDTNLRSQRATCGNISDSKFPNNHFGYGRLNAFEALKSVPTFVTTLGTTRSPDGTSATTLGTTKTAVTTTSGRTTAAVQTTTKSGTTAVVPTTTKSGTTAAKQGVLTILSFSIVSIVYKIL